MDPKHQTLIPPDPLAPGPGGNAMDQDRERLAQVERDQKAAKEGPLPPDPHAKPKVSRDPTDR